MSAMDAVRGRELRIRRKGIDESNRERLLRQMGGGNKGAATLISSMSRHLASSQGGTTLLRVEGSK